VPKRRSSFGNGDSIQAHKHSGSNHPQHYCIIVGRIVQDKSMKTDLPLTADDVIVGRIVQDKSMKADLVVILSPSQDQKKT